MTAVLLLLELLACVALSSAEPKQPSYSYHSQYPKHPPSSAYEGTPCQLPNGYLPYTCEAGTLLESRSEILPIEAYGPNVCRLTDVSLAREEEYVFRKQCAFEFDHHYYTYFYLCFLDCLPSGKCTNSTRNDTRENIHCCEGFTTSPTLKPSPVSIHLSQFVIPTNNVPAGCPIAQGNTLLQCLIVHGRFLFIEAIITANLTHLFNSTTEKITVFIPPDAALQNFAPESVEDAAQLVLSHTVQGEVHAEDILYDDILISLYSNNIFTSTVEHYYYRPQVHSAPTKGYYHYNTYTPQRGDYVLLNTDRYVSGAKIEVADACAPPSKGPSAPGVLHLVDRPLPHTNLTVAELLEGDPQFSIFVDLLNVFNILPYLDKFFPYTVFAPVNASFDIYLDALDCLVNFDRDPLNDLLLFHILDIAEYSSTLKARFTVDTKLLQRLTVETGDDGQIFLVGSGEPVPITQPDLLAYNGVVHAVPSLLIPDQFDLGVCAEFITMPPPVTSIDPSPSVMMVTPSTPPMLITPASSRTASSVSPLSSTLVTTPAVTNGFSTREGFGPI